MLLHSPEREIGWIAPEFTLDDAHGERYAFQAWRAGRPALITFICNHCPYVKAIIDRLVQDADALQAAGVAVMAIMPNDYQRYPDDNPAAMRAFAAKHGIDFPYLVDAEQTVAREFGAVCTPDFFGLDRAGALQYRGRLDDARMGIPTTREPELRNAMLALARNESIDATQQPSMGCSIKWRSS